MSPARVLTRASSRPGPLALPTSNSRSSLTRSGLPSGPAIERCCRMRRASCLPRKPAPRVITTFMSSPSLASGPLASGPLASGPLLFRGRPKVCTDRRSQSMLRAMAGTTEIFVFKDALIVLGTAAIVARVVHRLKISPILGFLVVGAALGPHGLGRLAEHSRAIDWLTVTGERQIGLIADFGIVFLPVFIGLALSMRRLLTMRRLVFGLGGLQVVVAALPTGAGPLWLRQPPAAALIIRTRLAPFSTSLVMELLSGPRRMMSATRRTRFPIP